MTRIPLVLLAAALPAAATALLAARLLRHTGAPIPAATAALLAATGAAASAARWLSGAWPGWWLPVPLTLAALAAPLALADIRHRRLPDILTLPAYPLAAAVTATAAAFGPDP